MIPALKRILYPTGRDELNAWAFRGKRIIEFERRECHGCCRREYVIVRKLEYFREGRAEKHLRDIRAILAVSGEQLDRLTMNDWIQRRGLEAEWRQVV